MSTRSKGKKYEKTAMAEWTRAGYVCWKPGNKAIFIGPGRCVSASQDIFEVYDFVAKHRDGGPVVFVQVTMYEQSGGGGHASVRRSKIDKLRLDCEHMRSVVQAWEKRKGWVLWVLASGEWTITRGIEKVMSLYRR